MTRKKISDGNARVFTDPTLLGQLQKKVCFAITRALNSHQAQLHAHLNSFCISSAAEKLSATNNEFYNGHKPPWL